MVEGTVVARWREKLEVVRIVDVAFLVAQRGDEDMAFIDEVLLRRPIGWLDKLRKVETVDAVAWESNCSLVGERRELRCELDVACR